MDFSSTELAAREMKEDRKKKGAVIKREVVTNQIECVDKWTFVQVVVFHGAM